MNRVLKYRAYDKIKKVMFQVTDLEFSWQTGELTHICGTLDDMNDWEWQTHDVELLEFTGLLDKNGTEIYEYDIIKTYSRHPETSKWYREPEIQIVRWNPHNAMFAAFHDMDEIKDSAFGNGTYIHKMNYGNWEVIGNIFENPEYLEE